jgi:hypothetical protein
VTGDESDGPDLLVGADDPGRHPRWLPQAALAVLVAVAVAVAVGGGGLPWRSGPTDQPATSDEFRVDDPLALSAESDASAASVDSRKLVEWTVVLHNRSNRELLVRRFVLHGPGVALISAYPSHLALAPNSRHRLRLRLRLRCSAIRVGVVPLKVFTDYTVLADVLDGAQQRRELDLGDLPIEGLTGGQLQDRSGRPVVLPWQVRLAEIFCR